MTIHFLVDFENETVGNEVDSSVDGYSVYPETDHAHPYVRSTIATPSGTKYAEWTTSTGDDEAGWRADFSPAITVSLGTAYYLAGWFRFERISGNDIWHDTGSSPYSFDKLYEFTGSGWRWGIGSGWNGWFTTGTDHKFTFDAWYATSVLGDHGPDHIVHDSSGYSASNPYLCDYETWYGVVLGITAQNSNSGRVQLWIDGTEVIDQTHYTAGSSPNIDHIYCNGTLAQSAYDAPPHKRQMDALIITDVWQDIIDGGYLGGETLLPGPTNLRWRPA